MGLAPPSGSSSLLLCDCAQRPLLARIGSTESERGEQSLLVTVATFPMRGPTSRNWSSRRPLWLTDTHDWRLFVSTHTHSTHIHRHTLWMTGDKNKNEKKIGGDTQPLLSPTVTANYLLPSLLSPTANYHLPSLLSPTANYLLPSLYLTPSCDL